MSSIFISHSSSDNSFSQQIADFLKLIGHQSFFLDFDPDNGIPPGRNWEKELYANLRKCQVVIVLYSRSFDSSRWCFAEITHARALGKYIVTIKTDDCAINGILTDVQIIDASNGFDGSVAERLEKGLIASGANKDDWDNTRTLYPGLLAFQEEDAPVFFGRQEETENLLKRLRQYKSFGGAKLLMVLGASGSGKSSLIRAGLIPRLRKDKKSWILIGPFRPLKTPFEELSKAIAIAFSAFQSNRSWKEIHDILIKDTEDVTDHGNALLVIIEELLAVANDPDATVLIFIDQFEELLTNKNEKDKKAIAFEKSFSSYLSGFIKTAENKYLIIGTLRSDFLGNFQENQSFKGTVFEDYIVQSVTIEGLRASIVGPARVAGIDLEEGLVEEILFDAATPDSLPLVAFTLRQLWEQYGNDGKLEVAEYKSLGGIGGSIARAAEAVLLAHIAETERGEILKRNNLNNYANLDKEDEKQLKGAFREMVSINGDGKYTKRPVSWAVVPEQLGDLLLRFVSARLLTRYGEGKDIKMEVAHEAIFRTWDRMVKWLEEDKNFLSWRKRLNLDFEEWQRVENNESDLLRGPSLAEAKEWLNQVKSGKYYLTIEEIEFIETSYKEAEKQRLRKHRNTQFLLAGFGLIIITISLLLYNAHKTNIEIKNQLARNYWDNSRSARAKGNSVEALLYVAEGVSASNDEDLTQNMVLDIQSFLPQCFPKAITGQDSNSNNFYNYYNSAFFSPDGKLVLTASGDSTARLWDAESGKQVGPNMRHRNHVNSAVFSPDGKRILTASDDSTARLWDAANGKQIGAAMEHKGHVWHAIFSPEGKRVLTVSDDSTARVWDAETCQQIGSDMKPGNYVFDAVFSPEGKLILTTCGDHAVHLWDAANGKQIGAPMLHRDGVPTAVFSPDGKRVLTTCRDNTARFWDAMNGKQIGPEIVYDGYFVNAVFSPDGKEVLTTSIDSTARFWDAISGKQIGPEIWFGSFINSAVFSPDGKTVLTASLDNTARFWDVATGKQIGAEIRHENSISTAIFGPDGKTILISSGDKRAEIWEISNDAPPAGPVMEHDAIVRSAVFSPDAKLIVTASDDNSARLWDASSGKQIGPDMYHGSPVNSAVFSPDGRRILTASTDYTARLWNVAGGKQIGPNMEHGNRVLEAIFSPDGKWILTEPEYEAPRLWDAISVKQIIPSFMRHGDVHKVVFSPDGRRILTAVGNNTAIFWDAATGEQIRRGMNVGQLTIAVFSPDGKRIFTACSDTLRLWDGADGKQIGSDMNVAGSISMLAFSPDGKRVLTIGGDDAAHLRDAGSGKQIGSDMKHGDAINSVVFSPDGKLVLTASDDHTARLWSATNGKQIGPDMNHGEVVYDAVFSPDGKWALTASGDFTAQLWDIGSDLDIPADLFKLQAMVATGFELNIVTGEIHLIKAEAWYKLKDEYNKKAAEHYKICKYRKYNFWGGFNPEEAKKIRASE